MDFIWIEILRGIVATAIIYFISYLIEKNSKLYLLMWIFNHKKNDFIGQGAANANAIICFLICLITLLIDLSGQKEIPEGYSFWAWFLIMIPICITYRQIYYKLLKRYDKIDNNVGNDGKPL